MSLTILLQKVIPAVYRSLYLQVVLGTWSQRSWADTSVGSLMEKDRLVEVVSARQSSRSFQFANQYNATTGIEQYRYGRV